jgi:diguanylate cyclase (GGDEF)-like protein
MAFAASSRKRSWRSAVRSWELAALPKDLIRYLVIVEVLAAGWFVTAVATGPIHGRDVLRLGLLAGFFGVFQQISTRVERMRIRMTDSHQIDMTSVWVFAGVIVLPSGMSALLSLFIGLAMSRLRWRSGVRAHRQAFNIATLLVSCLAATSVLHAGWPQLSSSHFPGGFTGAAAVVTTLVIFTTVNTAMVAGAIFLAARPLPVRALFGTGEENALEIATLCLGGLTALAVLYQPWLTFLTLIPMMVLQRGALIKQLEVAATTDPKTGLLNAVAWRQLAQKELARAERDRHTAAMLIVDMDKFKAVNDTYGHLVGDSVLLAVAQCLTSELREYDSIGRFGGEEFVAILPEVDAVTARVITDRILARVRALEIFAPDQPQHPLSGFSASIGVALYPAHGTDVEGLLHVADSALYAAKNAGRDRVEFVAL